MGERFLFTMNKLILSLLISVFTLVCEAKSGSPTDQYFPEGNAFICENGSQRFNRALYGSYDDYRIETSDRPVFALYRKTDNKNIRFRISYGGSSFQLDSADYCRASYEGGRRDYVLRDNRWVGGELRVSVLCFHDAEGAIWEFQTDGFAAPVEITALVCETSAKRFSRNGDICKMEKPGGFEAPEMPTQLETVRAETNKSGRLYAILDGGTLTLDAKENAAEKFSKAEKERHAMASSVTFSTPDPYINPLGAALVMAAEGAWNGQVWMHGAVGWRMPLPGWRAAYMGDFLGMPDKQRSHFNAYAKSQVTGVPVSKPHLMDSANNLARGTYAWGTPMYSNGYICRNPERNDQFHHYDMNLVFIDELLWHFSFDADTAYMRQMWPVLKSHLEWEKRTWDPDGDHLYDAYCCIWASDALQYNSGAVTHSSAYNYRANLLAARIAEIIGEDPHPYRMEAESILKAMNSRLWLQEGHWAEYQDFMGNKLLHKNPALWSIYTPIDCGACTPEQAYNATQYVDAMIPRITFRHDNEEYFTLSTSAWVPYEWSTKNVAMAEVMHTVLAYYKAGRPDAAYKLLKSNILDFMYLGISPGNFGQLSQHDAATGASYRDFSDVTGISSRALIEGLYGITPDALNGRCIIRPGFPSDWKEASIHTPYLDYSFSRENGKDIFEIRQNFKRPLKIVIRQNIGNGQYIDTECTSEPYQRVEIASTGYVEPQMLPTMPAPAALGTAFDDVIPEKCVPINIDAAFNANIPDIFENKYLSPRSPYTTLCLPTQGIGDWCSTKKTARIDDSGLRNGAVDGVFTACSIPFRTPESGKNIVYTSLWDNYPDSVCVQLSGQASHAYLMLAGSTNPMQSQFVNGEIRIDYTDGSHDTMPLCNPDNWCPIEQDYYHDGIAYNLPQPRPYRVGLSTGNVSRHLVHDLNTEKLSPTNMGIDGGAAQLLDVPLKADRQLRSLTLTTTANDVVIGLISLTLQK